MCYWHEGWPGLLAGDYFGPGAGEAVLDPEADSTVGVDPVDVEGGGGGGEKRQMCPHPVGQWVSVANHSDMWWLCPPCPHPGHQTSDPLTGSRHRAHVEVAFLQFSQ